MIHDPTCVGCGIKASKTGEYSRDNPVQEDGTYWGGYFVCTKCYQVLILLHKDVGSAVAIQIRAIKYCRVLPE